MELNFIRDLKVGLKNVNLNFIVLEVGRPSTTKEGHEIRTCKVADRSGCIQFSLWGELGSFIQVSDICRLNKGYVALWKNIPTLYMGKGGELVKTGEFCYIFSESYNASEPVYPPQPLQQQQQQTSSTNKLEVDNHPATITLAD